MKKTIMKLEIFQDEASGYYGVAPLGSKEKLFNAFWNGIGIFHDVFEHYFEGEHKYFTGDSAFNISGEIAAMGHAAYYVETFGSMMRMPNKYSIHSDEHKIVSTTHSDMLEMVIHGYDSYYGSGLISAVPRQNRGLLYNYGTWFLGSVISEHEYAINKLRKEWRKVRNSINDDFYASREDRERYLKSVKKSKVNDLYIWGYKQAEKIIPYCGDNRTFMDDFIEFWNKFCDEIDAELLLNLGIHEIHVERWVDRNGKSKWAGNLIGADGLKIDVRKIDNKYSLYDYI